MENESEQTTIDEALEAETVNALRRLFASDSSPSLSPPAERVASTTLIGEVTDTHHPDARGRILVKWSEQNGKTCERWLECMDGLTPGVGDRVLLQAPANWPEYLISATLKRSGCGLPVEPTVEPSMTLSLEAGKCMQVSDASGCPLLQLHASPDGPVVTLLNRNVSIEAAGTLRLSAQTLELEAGRGGVDIRTEADTVVRSRYVRLN